MGQLDRELHVAVRDPGGRRLLDAGNVALIGGRPVVFDWSDAAVGNPLVDLVTWLRDAPADERAAAWSIVADAWSDVAPAGAFEGRLEDAVVAGAAYQVLSYDGIIRSMEPTRRVEFADDLTDFLSLAAGAMEAAA